MKKEQYRDIIKQIKEKFAPENCEQSHGMRIALYAIILNDKDLSFTDAMDLTNYIDINIFSR